MLKGTKGSANEIVLIASKGECQFRDIIRLYNTG